MCGCGDEWLFVDVCYCVCCFVELFFVGELDWVFDEECVLQCEDCDVEYGGCCY